MKGFIGKFVALILLFIGLVVTPFVNTAVTEENANRISMLYDITSFVDEVVDSRQITDSMLKSFNTKISSYGIPVDYKITREMLDIEPDPLHTGEYYPAYIATDSNRSYNQGDHITIHVYSSGNSTPMTLANRVANIYAGEVDIEISARIR